MKQPTEEVKVGLKEKRSIKRVVIDLGPSDSKLWPGVRHGIITWRREITSVYTRDDLPYWTMSFLDAVQRERNDCCAFMDESTS